jgi:signal peptidase I
VIGGLAVVAMIVGIVVAVAVATGREGRATPVLPSEQADYLERAADLLSLLARDNAVNRFPLYYRTPEAGWVDGSAVAVEQWDQLGPPAALASVHQALGRHMHEMVTAYQQQNFRATLTFDEPWNKWWNAVEDYYGMSLFQVRDRFMEPAICRNDILVIPPTDGNLERWQLAVLKRGPIASEFKPKERPDEILRVAGLPGETVLVNEQGVFIDGLLREDDVYAPRQSNYSFGPVTVPAGEYFLLADRRWKAIDSRNSTKAIGAPTFYSPDQLIGELPADTRACKVNSPGDD